MKQKITLFKTIMLAAAMMLGGVSQAWADTSTLYNWGTTTDGDATVWTDEEKSLAENVANEFVNDLKNRFSMFIFRLYIKLHSLTQICF